MKHSNILIGGFKRSGTTLLYDMLRYTVKDYKFFDSETKILNKHKKEPKTAKITKKPKDIADLDRKKKVIPDLGVILCIRDPRDILVSRLEEIADDFHVGYDYSLKLNTTKVIGIDRRSNLRIDHQNCVDALKYNPFICYYEKLVNNPLEIQEKIRRAFNLRMEGSFLNFYHQDLPWHIRKQLNKPRPVDTDSIGRWKRNPGRIYEQFIHYPHLFDIVRYWGYEKDNSWFNKEIKVYFTK